MTTVGCGEDGPKKKSMVNLINRSGFKIIREDKLRIHPLSFYFKGIRPMLRFFFERVQIFELEKI